MNAIFLDLRYGFRMLLKSPVFTLVAVVTLALGIGANTAMFSIVNGVLLQPLPVEHADRLVKIYVRSPQWQQQSISYPTYLDWKRLSRSFEDMGSYQTDDLNLTGTGEPTRVHVARITASLLPTLGVQPLLGRNITPEEDTQGGNPVVLLTDAFWKAHFGGDPNILGRSITLSDVSYTVIGIVPADTGLFERRQAFISLGAWHQPMLMDRSISFGQQAVGRLKTGVSMQQAQQEMDGIARAMAQQFPTVYKDRGVSMFTLRDDLFGNIRPALLVLLGAVGFVLLIACANVANLLLARSAVRRREFAVRCALGARPGRLVRQLLTEGLLLSVGGAALGLLLANWLNGLFLAGSFDLPRAAHIRLDSTVLLFTALAALASSFLFSITPALQSAHTDVNATLKQASRGSSGRHTVQRTLVICEVAMALVLTAAAGLMIRTVYALWQINPGFDPHGVVTFAVFGSASSPSTPDAFRASYTALTDRFRSIPGVQGASAVMGALPLQGDWDVPYWVVGRPKPESQTQMPWTLFYFVEPDYREVMRIPLQRGRFLNAQDVETSPLVAVIDEDLARQSFPGEDAIGKHLHLELIGTEVEVVGVVGHAVQWGLERDSKEKVRAQIYMPFRQIPGQVIAAVPPTISYALRTSAPVGETGEAAKRILRQSNSRLVMSDVAGMEQILTDSLQERRFTRLLLGAFAALALLLAAVGIYGVLSYTVTQSTRDIGIRMALGARASQVVAMVLRGAMSMLLFGILIGAVAGLAITRLMQSMLYGVRAWDPITFVAVSAVLAVVGLLASYLPALRATAIDPMNALRQE